MVIPVNGFDANGLASLAGAAGPVMNLPLHNVDMGFEGMLARAKLQQQYAALQNNLAIQNLSNQGLFQRQQLANQGQLANTGLQNQGQLADTGLRNTGLFNIAQLSQQGENQRQKAMLEGYYQPLVQNDQQKTAIDAYTAQQNAAYNQGRLGIDQGQLGVAQQQANTAEKYRQSEAALNALRAKLMIDSQTRNAQGALSASYLAYMKNLDPNDPNYAQKAADGKAHFLQEGMDRGIITKDQVANYQNMSPQDLTQHAMADVYFSQMAGQAAKNPAVLNGLGLGGSVTPGTISIGPDGTITASAVPGQKTQEATQQDMIANNQMLASLTTMKNLAINNPDMFTYLGNKQVEWGEPLERQPEAVQKAISSIPGLQGLAPDQAQAKIATAKQFDTLATAFTGEYAKSLSAFVLRNKEFMESIKPSRGESYSSAIPKLYTLSYMAQQKNQLDALYNQHGIPLDQYNSQLNKIMDGAQNVYNMFTKTYTDTTGHPVNLLTVMQHNPGTEPEELIKEFGLKEFKPNAK